MSKVVDLIKKFEVGNIYEMRFIGDSALKVAFICTKKTAKTVRLEGVKGKEILNRRIKNSDIEEYILQGSYSMAPSIRAGKVIG